MKMFQASFVLLVIILIMLFCIVSCERDDWQDHLTDPLLDEPTDTEEQNSWIGKWNFISWWATDADGNIVEGPEEWNPGDEGGFTLNEDGTYVFNGLEYTAEGNYTVADGILTLEDADSWWGQPWTLSFEGNEMSIGMGAWPTGEGEGYILQEEEGDPWIGKWDFISWWATDADGNTVEGPEEWSPGEEGGLTLNEDGTYVFNGLEYTAEGNYTVADGILTLEGADSWWGQPWTLSFEGDEMSIGMGAWPTGEGEGYVLKKGVALTIVNAWGIIAWTEIDSLGNIIGQENVGTLTGEFEEADYLWFEDDNSFAWKWIAEEEEGSGVGTYELITADTVGITTTEESHWGGSDPAELENWHYVLMPGDTVKLHITNPEMGWLFIPMDMLPEESRTEKPEG